MKWWWAVLLLLVGAALPGVAKAQVSFYGEFSTSDLQGGPVGDYLYGASTGILVDSKEFFHHMVVSGDLRGRFVHKSTESLNGVSFGPRLSFPVHRFGSITPYAEFMVGFARYKDQYGLGTNTTDDTFQVNAGVGKRITSHFDVVAEYSYAQYGALNGKYNPKTYSIGAMYHLSKR